MSLRWRIALALAAVAAATTISVGIVSYRATSARLLEEVDRSLTQAWATIEADPLRALGPAGLLDVYKVQTVGPGARVTASNDEPVDVGDDVRTVMGNPAAYEFETVDTDAGEVRLLSIGRRNGAVQIGRLLDENDAVLADLSRRMIWIVALVTAAAAAVGWLIALSVTGPLVRLTRAATDVERSRRLDVDVPATGRDDEVGRLGRAFNGMLQALAASRDDQRRLVEDAGHELRTPLTSVRTNLAVLRRHPDLDPATRAKVIDDLHAETEELVALVEEVVAVAHGWSDEAPAERVALASLVRGIAVRAERRRSRPVHVVADDSVVNVPPAALERAISNLIDNATKFDVSGGPIDVTVVEGVVTVLDRGPGIDPVDRARVFDRFYRADGARSLPGSGLGLSIVRAVAEGSGGSVEVADRPGGGTAVSLRLPLAGGADQ